MAPSALKVGVAASGSGSGPGGGSPSGSPGGGSGNRQCRGAQPQDILVAYRRTINCTTREAERDVDVTLARNGGAATSPTFGAE